MIRYTKIHNVTVGGYQHVSHGSKDLPQTVDAAELSGTYLYVFNHWGYVCQAHVIVKNRLAEGDARSKFLS